MDGIIVRISKNYSLETYDPLIIQPGPNTNSLFDALVH